MAIPQKVVEEGLTGEKAAIRLAFRVTKEFGKVAGRQLKRGGLYANELMQVYKNVIKALRKM
mgnify:CR=1 FL=1|jgi:hypothetical protein